MSKAGRKIECSAEQLERLVRFNRALNHLYTGNKNGVEWNAREIGEILLELGDGDIADFFKLMAKATRSSLRAKEVDSKDREIIANFYKEHPELFELKQGDDLSFTECMSDAEKDKRVNYRLALMGHLNPDHTAKVAQWEFGGQESAEGKAFVKRMKTFGRSDFYKIISTN